MFLPLGESVKRAAVSIAMADLDTHLVGPPSDGPLSIQDLDELKYWSSQISLIDSIITFSAPVTTIAFATLPAFSLVLFVQANLQTAISTGGGATRMGIGWNDGGNSGYNKYGQYSSIFTKNTKMNKIPSAWSVNLITETWRLTAMGPSGGGILGTIGSAGQSVRVKAIFIACTSLPDVP